MGRSCSHRWVDRCSPAQRPAPTPKQSTVWRQDRRHKVNEQRGELQRYGATEEGHRAEPSHPAQCRRYHHRVQSQGCGARPGGPGEGEAEGVSWSPALQGAAWLTLTGLADPRPEKN
ncbi:unnamed protein product [Gadus morhua 'NCC']